MQSVSVPASTPCSTRVGAAWALPWGRWLPQPAVGAIGGRVGKPSLGTGPSALTGHSPSQDFLKADLLVIMGTSLQVQPFASLISK